MSSETPHEGRPEGRRRDQMPGIIFGSVLILLGVIFLLSTQGWIPSADWWKYFLIGLGAVFVIEALVRYARPAYRRHGSGRLIAGLILICIGVAFTTGIGHWWPLILIVIGLAISLNAWLRSR